jgi:hypothetical protein
VPLGDEIFAQLDHFRDVLGGLGFDVRPQDAEAVHVGVEGVDVGVGDGLEIRALTVRPINDLVVHVGEVADKGHLHADVAQVADQDVEDHGRAGVSDVAVVIGRDAADIHGHMAGLERDEFFLFPGEAVVDLHAHSLWLRWENMLSTIRMRSLISPAGKSVSRVASSGPLSLPVRARRMGW